MTTITFRYNDKSKEVCQNDAFIKDYSDDPDALGKIIRELTDLTCNLSITNSQWDSKQHLKSKVTIGYRGKKMQFDFYHSLNDTEEWGISRFDSDFLKNVLRDLLRTIRSAVYIHGLDFDEFCSGYDYDKASRKAYAFSAEEIESFPI